MNLGSSVRLPFESKKTSSKNKDGPRLFFSGSEAQQFLLQNGYWVLIHPLDYARTLIQVTVYLIF